MSAETSDNQHWHMKPARAIEQFLELDATIGLTVNQRRQVALLLSVAGFRTPMRILTTRSELDECKVGTVVCDSGSIVYQRAEVEGLADWEMLGSDTRLYTGALTLPVQVLS